MNVAIIPARGGSRRIPRKNIKSFHGKPIITYPIETAKESGLFDVIIVSTEDLEIGTIAYWNGAVTHHRKDKFAKDDVGTQEVARDCLIEFSKVLMIDYACVIYATSPLLTVDELKKGFSELVENPTNSYVYSVDQEGNDAGCFYWGKFSAFLDRIPLSSITSVKMPIRNACDINTNEDWDRAEQMYGAMNGH